MSSFDQSVQRNIRDFLAAHSWSVSRFAARYVGEYADKYSRSEAPGVSTARKLVEDAEHSFSEKEILVLDKIFDLGLYAKWLDFQRKLLIEKYEGHIDSSTGAFSRKMSTDSEKLLRNKVEVLNKIRDRVKSDDAAAVIRRYLDIECNAPLLIVSESELVVESLTKVVLADVDFVDWTDLIKLDIPSASPAIYTLTPRRMKRDDMRHCIDAAISDATRRKTILFVLTDTLKRDKLLSDIKHYGDKIICLDIVMSEMLLRDRLYGSWTSELTQESQESLATCFLMRDDFSKKIVSQMIVALGQGGVEFPACDDARDWMDFIEYQHERQSEILQESHPLHATYEFFYSHKFPQKWYTDQCHIPSLLLGIKLFAGWEEKIKERIEGAKCDEDTRERMREALENTRCCQFEALLAFGKTPERTGEEWLKTFDSWYNTNLVSVPIDLMVDLMTFQLKRKMTPLPDWIGLLDPEKQGPEK